ncbi:hypothetical protein [Clostridium saccharoperbutylacetonicum]
MEKYLFGKKLKKLLTRKGYLDKGADEKILDFISEAEKREA